MKTSEEQDFLERFKLVTVSDEKWVRDDVLGEGGFGRVWREVMTASEGREKFRAVKIVNKKTLELKNVDYRREILALATFTERLHNQRGVFVTFFGWFQDKWDISIAMEYFKYGSLKDCTGNKPLPESEAKDITTDILSGLSIMHQEGFAHRDLNPSNIFVWQKPPEARRWWVKIGDFGITKRAEMNLTTKIGTNEYMAPEIHGFVKTSSPSYDKIIDMWSLGCIIFEIVTGTRLFESLGNVSRFCTGENKFPEATLSSKLSGDGVELVKGLVTPDPQKRMPLQLAKEASWPKRPITVPITVVVTRRILRRHYGLLASMEFVPGEHDESRKCVNGCLPLLVHTAKERQQVLRPFCWHI
jgi:serine/threonine protein kinase